MARIDQTRTNFLNAETLTSEEQTELLAQLGAAANDELDVVTVSSASLSLTTEHARKYVRLTAIEDIDVTIPTNATQAIPTDSIVILWRASGAGTVTISPDSGVTLNVSNIVLAENEGTMLIKVDENEWDQL